MHLQSELSSDAKMDTLHTTVVPYTVLSSFTGGYRQKHSIWWFYIEKWFVLILVSSILSVQVNGPYGNFIVNSEKIVAATLYWVPASCQRKCSYILLHFHNSMQDYSSFKYDEKFNNLPKVKKAVKRSIFQTQAVGSKVLFIPLLYIVL